ncbi:ParB N-terminal domain-containing protein [Amycolatopsis lurida]
MDDEAAPIREWTGSLSGVSRPELEEAAARGSTVSLPLGVLRPADSPRLAGVDTAHARRLAESDSVLPPILVHRSTMRVVDGMHRLHAAELRGQERIEVQFVEGTPEEAFVLAVESNTGRSLALSLAEREAAASRIIVSYPHWSNRLIATKTRLAPGTVGAIRSRSTVQNDQLNRVGLDGRTRPLSAVAGRVRAGEVISERPEASLRTVARAAGISIGTARDVRERVRKGESPIPAGLSGEGRGDAPPEPAGESADLAEMMALWANLTNDPSLRQSESGRALLRWLSFHAIVPDRLDRLVEAVPAHSTESVRRVALRCAHAWQLLAGALAEKSRTTA